MHPRLHDVPIALIPTCGSFEKPDIENLNHKLSGLFSSNVGQLFHYTELVGLASDGDSKRVPLQWE